MKKVFFISVLTLVLSFFSIKISFAASISDNIPTLFYITSELPKSGKTQTTFENYKTFTGTAPSGSSIFITVYEKAAEKEKKLKEIFNYKLIVGASGYFSQNVDLSIGENIIKLENNSDNKYSSISTSVKRKKSEIKNELEQSVVLPRFRK